MLCMADFSTVLSYCSVQGPRSIIMAVRLHFFTQTVIIARRARRGEPHRPALGCLPGQAQVCQDPPLLRRWCPFSRCWWPVCTRLMATVYVIVLPCSLHVSINTEPPCICRREPKAPRLHGWHVCDCCVLRLYVQSMKMLVKDQDVELINAADNDGMTAAHWCAFHNHWKHLECLLEVVCRGLWLCVFFYACIFYILSLYGYLYLPVL